MYVTLYMAQTVNGYIARENDETPWSDVVWESYATVAKRFKAIIVGRRTYEIMRRANEFEKIGNPFIVILTTKRSIPRNRGDVLVKSSNEALDILKERGFHNVLVGGGGIATSSFMKENLIDEIILDIEPLLFGKGIRLFSDASFETRLSLIDVRKLSEDVLQLHYRVLK